MICRNCLRTATRSHVPSPTAELASATRFLSTTAVNRNVNPITTSTATTTAPRQGTLTSSHTLPPATSTSAAQPFSEPITSSPKTPSEPSKPSTLIMSSVPAGTPLRGLNFLKNQSDPIAMEDHEYPAWLWDILKKQEKKAESGKEGDLFSKSKKQRRLAAKRLRKEQLANPDLLVPKVPIYEQTIDLPSGDGSVQGAVKAQGAREELTKAMRVKRRGAIKEANFLKAMR
ncbi:hypothetical protein K469DRAFT_628687 [Zopfia rhizophila CBS 207.26]|uniref:Large ribosomal subunit protein mL54 n=1 Tax=Zopfia rhizophila CBS 207.26 TaxID=1314779 RepID=A0A6A6E9M6_9PEZI|nr:hypothetical protein K469DRAFT_628687 [Zopfia rhizophila CBS 207.26]